MNFKSALSYIAIAALAACASDPSLLYSSLNQSNKPIATTNSEMIKNTHAVSLPVKIHGFSLERKSYEITAKDPVVNFGDFKSNYKLFSFKVDHGNYFQVRVISFCDCLAHLRHCNFQIPYFPTDLI